MKLKVCGNKDVNSLDELMQMVDYVGFIFFKNSPRDVSNDMELKNYCLSKKTTAKKVGVFVNESVENIHRKIEEFNLDLVQLHGDESPLFCENIRSYVPVIKVFRIDENEMDFSLHDFQDSCDYFLFDKKVNGKYGGTGVSFDWKILNQLKINTPFFLGGGISAGDVKKILAFDHPYLHAIDINSQFEHSPGMKDAKLIKEFIRNLNHE